MILTLEQKIDLLLQRDIVRTQFETVVVGQSFLQGQPIGQGGCKAVILQLNTYATNVPPEISPVLVNNDCLRVYYGDRTRQLYELTTGATAGLIPPDVLVTSSNSNRSEIIFCKDLSEVYVRRDMVQGELLNFEPFIQVLIYHGRDTEDTQIRMNNGN